MSRKPRFLDRVMKAGLWRLRAQAHGVAAVDKKVVLVMPIHLGRSPLLDRPFVFEEGHRRDIEEVGRLSGETRHELRFMYERLDQGDRFFMGRSGGQLAFNAWLMFGEMEIGGGVTGIAPDAAYSYKVFSAPAFRRSGLARGYYAFIRPFLAQLGYRSLVCHIRHDNVASMRLHQSVGFHSVGVVWDAHLGPLRRAILIPDAPRLLRPAVGRGVSVPAHQPATMGHA